MNRILETFQKNWPTYLFEILVLIIGIYGAFALDEWNEDRKSNLAEQELLTNLRTDFELRLAELAEHNEGRRQAIMAIDKIIENINAKKLLQSTEELDSMLSYLDLGFSFNDEFSSLSMLFSSGKINTIGNARLRTLLIKWPWLVEEMLEEQRFINTDQTLGKIVDKYTLRNSRLKQLNFRDYKLSNALNSDLFVNDYTELLGDRLFANALTTRRAFLVVNIIDGEKLIDLGNGIINTLNQEITK